MKFIWLGNFIGILKGRFGFGITIHKSRVNLGKANREKSQICWARATMQSIAGKSWKKSKRDK